MPVYPMSGYISPQTVAEISAAQDTVPIGGTTKPITKMTDPSDEGISKFSYMSPYNESRRVFTGQIVDP